MKSKIVFDIGLFIIILKLRLLLVIHLLSLILRLLLDIHLLSLILRLLLHLVLHLNVNLVLLLVHLKLRLIIHRHLPLDWYGNLNLSLIHLSSLISLKKMSKLRILILKSNRILEF